MSSNSSWPVWLVVALIAFGGGLYAGRTWLVPPETVAKEPAEDSQDDQSHDEERPQMAKLSLQAQKNIGLKSLPVKPTTYWRTLEIPGAIDDRPGVSDRGVVAPVTGIVTKIFHYPGDTVDPNAVLFTIRLVSESLHASQLELFKASREIEIAQEQSKRLASAGQSGAVPQSRLIEVENQIRRLEATVQAYQQDLQARGLPVERIGAAAKGEFVTEINVRAPGEQAVKFSEVKLTAADDGEKKLEEPQLLPFTFELNDLSVELGQQVNAGEVLCKLADHRALLIEGRGFKEDMTLIQEAARSGASIEIEFEESTAGEWPALPKRLQIHHVANTIDRDSRTFGFYLALENQWSSYQRDGQTRLLWRFRPGDRVRLHVSVAKMENVLVLPQEAIVREGPEAYIFRQNGELFDRRPVHVLFADRRNVIVANDGSVRPGQYVAQGAAASINRVMKSQAASGEPVGMHVHADGSVHGAH